MGGRGRCLDNVFIERVCRSLKYEAVYLHDIADGFAAERVVGDWMRFCNGVRPHSSLNGRTPVEAYRFGVPLAKAAGPALLLGGIAPVENAGRHPSRRGLTRPRPPETLTFEGIDNERNTP